MPKATSPLEVLEWVSPSGHHQLKDEDLGEVKELTTLNPPATLAPVSSFRNVSACHRCRSRKHRCDSSLPRCQPCERAQVKCVGYDPITKQEIPRSYVHFLETRLKYLDTLLQHHNVEVRPVSAFDESEASSDNISRENVVPDDLHELPNQDDREDNRHTGKTLVQENELSSSAALSKFPASLSVSKLEDSSNNIIMNLLAGSSMRCKILKSGRNGDNAIRSSIRTSFFGLFFGKSNEGCAELPRRRDANILVDRYFEHVNTFMPALHRDDIDQLIDHAYSSLGCKKQSRNLYILHIVFAIGAAVKHDSAQHIAGEQLATEFQRIPGGKRQKISSTFDTSEAYEASAMIYLESYLALSPSPGLSNSLEELQALVLLCSLSLLRPTVPSLASLVDTAMRSATDLRLYSDRSFSATFQAKCSSYDSSSRRLAVRNQHLGRRLWWCAYSLDRLIAPWLGRPLSIPDDVVTTEIPHVDDDQSLSEFGFIRSSGSSTSSGYATHHHLKLRRLQSEIHCMLQSQHALRANASQPVDSRRETLTIPKQSGPFISWQRTMTDKLDEWRWSIPYSSESGRSSCDLLMELGYWQTIITLYRQIIIIPKQLVGLSSANEAEVEQLMSQTAKEFDVVYSRVAEASQKVIRIYRALQSMDLINIAYFAGDQIFIAGSLFLFTIWNSDHIRRCLSFQDIDSIVLTVTAVLDQMSDQSPTARISRTVFQQMSTTTIQYFLSTSDAHNNPMPLSNENHYNLTPGNTTQNTPSPFTFELTDHGKPQLPTLDFLEQADLSRDHKAGIWDDQLDKKDMFEVPIQLPFSFDGPDLLSQFAMGGQDSEALSKMPFGTNGLKREFQFTANDLDIDTAFAIPLNLQDEQSSDPDTPITGLSDELLRGLLVGWADP